MILALFAAATVVVTAPPSDPPLVTASKVSQTSKTFFKTDVFNTLDPSTKVICRREQFTGSLLAVHKICMTKASWDERFQNSASILGYIQGVSSQSAIAGSGTP